MEGEKRWVRGVRNGDGSGDERGGFEPFFVRGREVERSVVTGRTAGDVLRDGGVEEWKGRGGWIGKG